MVFQRCESHCSTVARVSVRFLKGQFNKVLVDELPEIKEAFKKFNTKERKIPYEPKLSIVICGKRHHARFYPTNSAFADRNGNTRPGTVVDKGVTAV
jgi:eukaryotic translation initiation factor 2C